MKKTTDIKHEVIAQINGYDIIRSEVKELDALNNPKGKTKVFYDVCQNDDLLESFKTLAKAKSYTKNN